MRVRFRPTLWPGTIIQVPAIRPMHDVEVEGDWILWPVHIDPRQVELPQDFYLREMMDIGPTDLEAAADIMRNYGILFDFNQKDLQKDRRIKLPDSEAFDAEYPFSGFHKDEVRLHIETAQRAIRTWLALQSPDSYEALEELVEPELSDESYEHFKEHSSPGIDKSREHFKELVLGERVADLSWTLNAALSRISVGIVRDPFGEASRLPGYHTVYTSSFLQLYNHMVEEATIRHCANEPCGRPFVRQRGRARFEQHRTEGIMYCSRECARAQAQRELRRRRRNEKLK